MSDEAERGNEHRNDRIFTESLNNKVSCTFGNDEGRQVQHGELVPGLDRYLKVKALLEKKYGQHITYTQMRLIFGAVLSDMKHEKLVKKRYGESKNYWKKRLKDKE